MITRRLRGHSVEPQGNLYNLWGQYDLGKLTTDSPLENSATLYLEFINLRFEKDADDIKYDYSSNDEE